jgi:thioredoxin 1
MPSFSELINSDKPVLLEFFAEWCGPCKMMAPILEQVKEELGDTLKILKIDIDKNQKLATSLQVKGVPTLMIYKNGKRLWRQSGLLQKKDLIIIINQYS